MKKHNALWLPLIIFFLFTVSCATNAEQNKTRKLAKATRSLGEAYLSEGRYAPAFRELKKSQQLDPEDPHTYFALGVFYFKKKNYDMAILEYKKTLEIKPDFASAKNNLGVTYLAKEDWDAAINCFKELIDNYIYATPHYSIFLTGQAYYHKKQYKLARQYFKDALELDPNYVFAQHWLGRTYIKMGKTRNAIFILNKAIKKSPDFIEFHYDLGRAYNISGKHLKAIEEFNKVIELNPETPLAQNAQNKINHIKEKAPSKRRGF